VLKIAALVVGVLVFVASLIFALAFRQALLLWYDEIAEIDE
jgi:hypothetical protein